MAYYKDIQGDNKFQKLNLGFIERMTGCRLQVIEYRIYFKYF
jgi:hypothetical protein